MILERVKARTLLDRGCWIWQGSTNGRYGHVWVDGRLCLTHRVTWEATHGPIPDGLVLDHLCRVTLCCNPDHLEPVTQKVNRARGLPTGPPRKTQCVNGHDLAVHGRERRGGGARVGRYCAECNRQSARARYTPKDKR